jgi:hypothetical protein
MSSPKQPRRLRRLLVRLTAIICVMAVVATTRQAFAQTTSWTVSTGSELAEALTTSFQNSVTNPSLVNTITLGSTITGSSQWIVNANVNIVGGGYTIDMNNADRAFFIAGGTVSMSNLTISNGLAAGGNGGLGGGGGGAGLGGAILVGSGSYFGGAPDGSSLTPLAATGISAPNVSLNGVLFLNNQAQGGSPTVGNPGNQFTSGGGGMGGNGASIGNPSGYGAGGGGGGGFGIQANGNGSPGEFTNVVAVTTLAAGSGGSSGGAGGANGGGGGAGGAASFLSDPGSGGGGGVGGAGGHYANDSPPNDGGNGGFGGGGGSAASGNYGGGGNGGFGGGGGSSSQNSAGSGGFGGGGGAGESTGGNGLGGFGAGDGLNPVAGGIFGVGGGGLGAGGAIFVMPSASLTVVGGSFSNNAVAGGTPVYDTGPNSIGNRGSAYGADLFLGANVTFSIAGGQSVLVNSLGGAGNLSDANVVGNASDPNAQGGVIKTGAGTLVLTGSSYYSGVTTIHSGTLALAAGAMEQGTTVVTVGQNAGDVATLVLGSSSNLTLGGFGGVGGTDAPIVIAQAAGSTGTIIIGDGAASSGADLGARVITGGSGTATLRFTQQFAAGSGSDPLYPFYTTLTGSLALVQEGIGTTSLQPLYGANTFAGAVTVNAGVLATTGSAAALAGVTEITVNSGGTLALGQSDGVNNLAGFTLAGGVLQTGTSLSETFGALAVTGSTSLIDFLGNAATLNFATLDLGGNLSIWNYSGATDFLEIATGTATGSLEQISFYSDAGTTFLGRGGFESTRLVPVPVPEPATIVLVATGLGGLIIHRLRRRMRQRC